MCRATSVTYEIKCLDCENKEFPGKHKYIGETSGNAYSRGREYLLGLKGKRDTSFLWGHCNDAHSGEVPQFQMSVLKRYKNDFMMRQIMEAVGI
jgi:hypothetical protein